ncbi:MAG: hypothetical protein WBA36_18880 [Mesorhizobium sp.]
MKLARTCSENPIDELCQLRDEMRVVWCALGAGEESEGYLDEIREHVNGIANHLGEVIRAMSAAPARKTGGSSNA